MTTTSTEYAITKRGMSPHLRKRDKPLRTYGKRPQNNGDEPPTKKRRCSSADQGVREEKLRARDQQHTTTTNTGKDAGPENSGKSREAEETKGPKGSILSYFKRVEVKTARSEESKTSEEEAEREGSPRPAQRKPRLLRLRATSTTDTEPLPPPRTKRRPPLEEGSAGNHQDPTGGDMKKKKQRATAAATTVQTVLNISPQATFSECKVCDTVWNPLWPDDVKYHLKRHAAAVGRRKREEGKLLL